MLVPSVMGWWSDSGRWEATVSQSMLIVKWNLTLVTAAIWIRLRGEAYVGSTGGNMPTNVNLEHGCG